MGTIMTHKAFGRRAEESLQAVCGEVARLEALLSRFRPGSDIDRVNRSAGRRSEKVSRETYDLLARAGEFSCSFPGCFDLTVAPLVTLWHAARESAGPPEESQIKQVLPLVNHRDLVLDPWRTTAGLRQAGQGLDLGGIGKGYAGDRIAQLYARFGIRSAYSNLGGNVVAVGARWDGRPWQIGIQHPRREDRLIGSVSAVDQSVVTSGDYQRCFTGGDGKRYHHILDPATGRPAESGLISVTVVADRSVTADALSTILFVAGPEKGLGFLAGFRHAEAVLVDAGLQVRITKGLRDRFEAEKGVAVTILS